MSPTVTPDKQPIRILLAYDIDPFYQGRIGQTQKSNFGLCVCQKQLWQNLLEIEQYEICVFKLSLLTNVNIITDHTLQDNLTIRVIYLVSEAAPGIILGSPVIFKSTELLLYMGVHLYVNMSKFRSQKSE